MTIGVRFITTINISGYYREAPVVVLRGPQQHQQQAHQHQAQHQQQVSLSVHCSESTLGPTNTMEINPGDGRKTKAMTIEKAFKAFLGHCQLPLTHFVTSWSWSPSSSLSMSSSSTSTSSSPSSSIVITQFQFGTNYQNLGPSPYQGFSRLSGLPPYSKGQVASS